MYLFEHDLKKTHLDFLHILLFIFILGATTISYLEGLSKLIILYGFGFTLLYMVYILYIKKIYIQTEVIVYFAWVLWSIGGYINSVNKQAYIEGLRTIIQIGCMFFVISGLTATRFNMFNIAMIGLLVGGIIQSIFAFSTGELTTAVSTDMARVSSLSKNANNFAFQMLIVIFAIFYFWRENLNRIIQILLLFALFVAVISIIYSGSRNGFLGFIAFLSLWYLFCKPKKLPKHPILTYLTLIIIVIVVYLLIVKLLENTLIWNRFSQFEDNSTQTRIFLYKEGIEMIMKKPFFGIGLNNFSELSSTGLYSHSDYLEVAANTGVIGFILYFSIYFILWLRINRIKKIIADSQHLYITGVLKASILTILIFGFGKPHITSKLTWIFLAAVAGYTSYLKHNSLKFWEAK